MDCHYNRTGRFFIVFCALAVSVLGGCVEGGESYEPALESSEAELGECNTLCKTNALKIFKSCYKNTGDKVECYASTRGWLDSCVRNWCAPPPTCEESCEGLGDVKFDRCQARQNTDPVECSEAADQKRDSCLVSRCGHEAQEDVVQEPIDCLGEGCGDDGDIVCEGEECEEDGASCVADCREQGGAVYESCVTSGEEKAACQEKATFYVQDCSAGCQG